MGTAPGGTVLDFGRILTRQSKPPATQAPGFVFSEGMFPMSACITSDESRHLAARAMSLATPGFVLRRAFLALALGGLAVSCDGASEPSEGEIASIEVTPPSLNLTAGTTRALTAKVLDASGEPLGGAPVFWSTQDPGVATVSAAGIVTAVAPGETQIAASKGGKSAIVPVTVVGLPVGLVRVSPTTSTVLVGATTTLSAEVFDAGGAPMTGRPVTWSSNNPATATVGSDGVVIGVTPGVVSISATASGVRGTAVITVRPVPVASVTISPTTGSVFIGQSLQLTAATDDSTGTALPGRPVTWTSSAPSTASVSSNGLVTGLFPGTVTITATSEGKSGTAQVSVTLIPVNSIQIIPSSATISVGKTAGLIAQLLDAAGAPLAGRTVTWSSDKPQIASVASDGVVTAVSAGQATVTATAEGKSTTASITVTPVPVGSVSISPTSASITAGSTQQFSAVVKDAQGNVLGGRVVSWLSGAPAVATIDQTGRATAIGTGSAIIIATSEGQQATGTLTVTAATVSSVRVTPANNTLQVGQTQQLSAVVSDGSGNPLPGKVPTWASSATTVATVSSSGLVTAVGAGTATITATSDGVDGTASVLVAPVPVGSVNVTPSNASLPVGGTLTLQVALADATGNTLPTTGRVITYTSNAATIASVSTAGVVTALSAGSADIVVASEGKSATATITVTAPVVASVDVTPNSSTLSAGGTVQLTAVAKDANGAPIPGIAISWSTSDGLVATVNTSGLVTAVAAGSASITATAGTVLGIASVAVTAASSVGSVTETPTASNLLEGQTVVLTATPRDGSGNPVSNPSVTWTVSNGKASLSKNSGTSVTATAKDSGGVTVTATHAGQAGTASLTISLVPVASVVSVPFSILPTISLQAKPNRSARETFRVLAANGSRLSGRAFSVTSSDPARLTVAARRGGLTDGSGEGEFDAVMTSQAKKGMIVFVTVTVEGRSLTWTVIGT